MTARIVLTGGLGFIGFNLLSKLQKLFKSTSFLIIDNLSTKSKNQILENSKIKLVKESINLKNLSKIVCLLNKEDIIIHLAALGNVSHSIIDPFPSFKSNVESTLALLEAMRIVGANKIIFSSTGGALMGNTHPPVDEESIPSPISPYGASKLAAEGYIRAFNECYSNKSIICRFGNVYGRYSLHKQGVINKFIINALNSKRIEVRGDGNTTRDYIHVDDICDALVSCILKLESMANRELLTLHLSNSEEVSLEKLICIIEDIHGEKLDRKYVNEIIGEVKRNAALSSKAAQIINFSPRIKLDDGLKDLYLWLKKDTLGFKL